MRAFVEHCKFQHLEYLTVLVMRFPPFATFMRGLHPVRLSLMDARSVYDTSVCHETLGHCVSVPPDEDLRYVLDLVDKSLASLSNMPARVTPAVRNGVCNLRRARDGFLHRFLRDPSSFCSANEISSFVTLELELCRAFNSVRHFTPGASAGPQLGVGLWVALYGVLTAPV